MPKDEKPKPTQDDKHEDLDVPEKVAEDVKGGAPPAWKKPSGFKLNQKG
jgi:hypothetical protein